MKTEWKAEMLTEFDEAYGDFTDEWGQWRENNRPITSRDLALLAGNLAEDLESLVDWLENRLRR